MEANMQSDMKVPSRPAPPLPSGQNRKTRSHTLDLLSLGNDPFSKPVEKLNSVGSKQNIKKKPPPRPPPPKYKSNTTNKGSSNLLDIFGRSKDTSRSKAAATAIVKPLPPVKGGDVAIDSLIDLHSPSISPTFTKSSSSGVSVDSIRSLVQSSSFSSQVESGFEDDFISSSSTTPSNDPFTDCLDPFSPKSKVAPEAIFELSNEDPKAKYRMQKSVEVVNRPTIIRVKGNKPSRPPPPSGKSAGSGRLPGVELTPAKGPLLGPGLDVTSSPPMPTVPPPPPPPEAVQALISGPQVPPRPTKSTLVSKENKEPYCIAEYTYEASHPDDLSFSEGDKIHLIAQVNDDWLKGRLSGKEGIFPANYVKVIVPLSEEEPADLAMTVIALFPFIAETWDDLNFQEGEEIKVLRRINENWLYGECNNRKGQFPENFVQDITHLFNDSSL